MVTTKEEYKRARALRRKGSFANPDRVELTKEEKRFERNTRHQYLAEAEEINYLHEKYFLHGLDSQELSRYEELWVEHNDHQNHPLEDRRQWIEQERDQLAKLLNILDSYNPDEDYLEFVSRYSRAVVTNLDFESVPADEPIGR